VNWLAFGLLKLSTESHLGESLAFFFYDVLKIILLLGGVFVPLASVPDWLQILARLFPLTYAVEALRAALSDGSWATAALDLGALSAFSVVLFLMAVSTLARHND
jgi:ABC-type multidrug transport system permease subunit